ADARRSDPAPDDARRPAARDRRGRSQPRLPDRDRARGADAVNPSVTWAVGRRVLWQIRRDPRTIALFIVMFLITSIAMLRERTSGTLERQMTMPMSRLDLLVGYGVAFGILAAIQAF